MLLRRIVALFTMLGLVHLSVARGEAAACASHATEGAAGVRSAGGSAGHAGHAMASMAKSSVGEAAGASSSAPGGCDMPTSPKCCDAAVPCASYGLLAAQDALFAPAPALGARIIAAPDDAPASFASAPEPPPPKA